MPFAEFQPGPVNPIGSFAAGANLFERIQQSRQQREQFEMEKQKFASDVAFQAQSRDLELQTQQLRLKQSQMTLDQAPRELSSHLLALDAQDAESRSKIANEQVVAGLIKNLPGAIESATRRLNDTSVPARERLFAGTQFLTNYGHLVGKSPQIGELMLGIRNQVENLQFGIQSNAIQRVPVYTAKIGAAKTLEELNAIAADPDVHYSIAAAPELKVAIKDQRDFLQKQVEVADTKAAKKTEEDTKRTLEQGAPGYEGIAPTKEEAIAFRDALATNGGIIADIKKIADLAAKPGASTDLATRAEIANMQSLMVGKLRLPLTGPGAMTDDERKFIISTLGNPANIFSIQSVEQAKIKTMIDHMQNDIDRKAAALGLKKSGAAAPAAPGSQTASPAALQAQVRAVQAQRAEKKKGNPNASAADVLSDNL